MTFRKIQINKADKLSLQKQADRQRALYLKIILILMVWNKHF